MFDQSSTARILPCLNRVNEDAMRMRKVRGVRENQ